MKVSEKDIDKGVEVYNKLFKKLIESKSGDTEKFKRDLVEGILKIKEVKNEK